MYRIAISRKNSRLDRFRKQIAVLTPKRIIICGLLLVFWLAGNSNLYAQDPVADFDYPRLAHPEIAEFLELTDAQRLDVTRLVAELSEKIAAATETDRAAVTNDYRGQIKAILTAEQNERMLLLPELRKLKFNFVSPKWEDVLRWFAKQADLSLVMNDPPSGAFNYTDNREHTPAEAIDLLNSILLTKGFTLVRREKLLILVEIKDGIPDEILPRLTLDELDKRGTFEIVSVLFSLGDKPLSVVEAEIKPILGSYGKMASLPNSRQLLVTETVGKIRAINLLIQTIPSPVPPPAIAQPVPPEPPVLESFALGALEPVATIATLKQLAPAAIITGDSSAAKLVAYGPPSQLAIVKSYLEQLNSGAAPDGALPKLQIFSLATVVDGKQLLEQILLVTPQAKVALDEVGQRLLVFATESQQAQVQETLKQLNVVESVDAAKEVQIFHLRRANPSSVSQMALAVSPRATVTVDTATSALVVRASSAELAIIRQLVEQMENGGIADDGLSLKSFSVRTAPSADFLTMLQSLAPRAKIQSDTVGNTMFVIASTADLAKLEPLIQQYQAIHANALNSLLVSYELTAAQKTKFQNIALTLVAELGAIKVVTDTTPTRLTIWGSPEQHEFIGRIIEQIKAEPDPNSAFELKSVAVNIEDPDSLLTILKPLHPQASLSLNSSKDKIVVWAGPEDQAKVTQSLQRFLAEMPVREEAKYVVYQLQQMDPAQALSILQPLTPNAKLTVDAPRRRLTVFAKPRDQARIAQGLGEFNASAPESAKSRLVVYPVPANLRARFNAVLAASDPEFSQVKIIDEQRPGELALLATDVEHGLIQSIVDQLLKPVVGVDPFVVHAYPTGETDPTQVADFLKGIFGDVKMVSDPVGMRLLIWAPASTHLEISRALQELTLNQPVAGDNSMLLQSYRLPGGQASTMLTLLQKLVPRMQLVASTDQSLIMAWGRPHEHEKLKLAVSQINLPDGPQSLSVELYSTGKMDAQQAAALLTKLLPDATVIPQLSTAAVTVLARGEQHKLIRQTLEQVGDLENNDGPLTVNVYRVDRSGSVAAIAAIGPLVPQARLVAGASTTQIIGLATERDQLRIGELIGLLETDMPDISGLLLRTYQLRNDLASQVRPIIQAALPALKMIGTDPGFFAVWARDEDHQRLKAMIEEAERQLVTGPKTFRSFELEKVTATQAKAALLLQLPPLAFVELANERSITVLGTAEEHGKIETILTDLQSTVETRVPQQVASYPIPDTSLTLLIDAIPLELSKQATIKSDLESNSLVVTAPEAVQSLISAAIVELQTRLPKLDRAIPRIYIVDKLQASNWQALLAQIAPTAVVVFDPTTGSLVVSARPQVHKTILMLIDEFRAALVEKKIIRAYRVSRADLQVASLAITSLVANGKINVDPTTKSLLVVASEADHEIVAQALDQIDRNAPNAAVSQVYPVPSGDSAALAIALKSLVPSGAFVADTTGKSLLVLATVDEQATIKTTIDQWTGDPSRALTSQVYALNRADPQAAATVLQKLLPGATLAVDLASRSLAATATSDQHRLIAETVKELDDVTQSPISKVYPASGLPAKDWQALMLQLAPGAAVATDPATNSLVVTARPPVHAMMETLLEDFREVLTSGKTARAYLLTHADVTVAAEAISSLLPNVKVSADKLGRTLIVVADEKDQATAAETLDQIDRNAPNAAVSQVYPVPSGDAAALAIALKSLVPSGAFVADTTGKSLLVLATVDEQATIKTTIDQWTGDPSRALTSQVYALNRADPQAAATVLQKLLPGATFAVDLTTRSLVATASAEQHRLIEQTATALDGAGNKAGGIELRSYVVTHSPAASLATALQTLFKNDAQVSVVSEKDSRSLIAVARPHQHEMIKALIASAEEGLTGSAGIRQLRTYLLTRADGKALVASLTDLFENEPVIPQLSFDASGQRILALASPEQHLMIEQTLKPLQGEPQEFEVFRLTQIDVQTAASALRNMFRDEPPGSEPAIDVDYDNQSLIVRATVLQLNHVKDLLVQLGETSLVPGAASPRTGTLRVIPLNQDVEQVWEQLQQIWPQIRQNELRIIRPQSIPVLPRKELPPADSETSIRQSAALISVASATHMSSIRTQQNAQDLTTQIPNPNALAPILLIPEKGRLILTSSDVEALNQLEELLSVIQRSGSPESGSRNFQIFMLQNAGAEEVAVLLRELFKGLATSRQGAAGMPVVITADGRLNMIIVRGSRSDREIVNSLMQALDSPDLPNALALNQPVIIPVRNTDADRILTILNSLYRTQLSSGGGRKQVAIPEGISAEVATLLQQVNAATSGPVLTLGVDTITNSIIVMAPQQLRDQVRAVVEDLDHVVEVEPGEAIEIIRLRDTSPVRIQRALDLLMEQQKK